MSRSRREATIPKDSLVVGTLLNPKEDLLDGYYRSLIKVEIKTVQNDNYTLECTDKDNNKKCISNFNSRSINEKFKLGPIADEHDAASKQDADDQEGGKQHDDKQDADDQDADDQDAGKQGDDKRDNDKGSSFRTSQ